MLSQARYTAISRKVVGKNVHATILKGNMGCWSIHCSWHTELLNLLLLLSFTTRKQTSKTSGAILSYFFEEKWAQNHPQSLSGLLPVLFPTTYLEIAVCILSKIQLMVYYQFWVLIGGATTRLYISSLVAKSAGFENQNNRGWIAFCWLNMFCRDIFDQLVRFY